MGEFTYKTVDERTGFIKVPFDIKTFLMFIARLKNRRAIADDLMTLEKALGHLLEYIRKRRVQLKGNYQ